MKKLLISLCFLFIFFISTNYVQAVGSVTFEVIGSTSIQEPNSGFGIGSYSIEVKSISGTEGITSIKGYLKYDYSVMYNTDFGVVFGGNVFINSYSTSEGQAYLDVRVKSEEEIIGQGQLFYALSYKVRDELPNKSNMIVTFQPTEVLDSNGEIMNASAASLSVKIDSGIKENVIPQEQTENARSINSTPEKNTKSVNNIPEKNVNSSNNHSTVDKNLIEKVQSVDDIVNNEEENEQEEINQDTIAPIVDENNSYTEEKNNDNNMIVYIVIIMAIIISVICFIRLYIKKI